VKTCQNVSFCQIDWSSHTWTYNTAHICVILYLWEHPKCHMAKPNTKQALKRALEMVSKNILSLRHLPTKIEVGNTYTHYWLYLSAFTKLLFIFRNRIARNSFIIDACLHEPCPVSINKRKWIVFPQRQGARKKCIIYSSTEFQWTASSKFSISPFSCSSRIPTNQSISEC